MNSYKYSLFYEVRQSISICRENTLGNPKAVKMVQKHTISANSLLNGLRKKVFPFLHQLPGSEELQGLPYTLMSEEAAQFSTSQTHFTEQETNQQLEKHSLKLVLQGEFPLAMHICH